MKRNLRTRCSQFGFRSNHPLAPSMHPSIHPLRNISNQCSSRIPASSVSSLSSSSAMTYCAECSDYRSVKMPFSCRSCGAALCITCGIALGPYVYCRKCMDRPPDSIYGRTETMLTSRSSLKCASENCQYLVHEDPAMGGFCCMRCHWESCKGNPNPRHGNRCQRRSVIVGASSAFQMG